MKLLEDKRIYLRALEPEDLDTVYRWENDSSLWQLSNTLEPFSRFVLKLYLERVGEDLQVRKQVRMMIMEKDTREAIGTVDLFDVDFFNQRAGVGVFIESSYRENGYASEAVGILLRYAFEHLCLHQVYCNVGADNEQSLALFEKLGFVLVGEKKDWARTADGYQAEWLLQKINA